MMNEYYWVEIQSPYGSELSDAVLNAFSYFMRHCTFSYGKSDKRPDGFLRYRWLVVGDEMMLAKLNGVLGGCDSTVTKVPAWQVLLGIPKLLTWINER